MPTLCPPFRTRIHLLRCHNTRYSCEIEMLFSYLYRLVHPGQQTIVLLVLLFCLVAFLSNARPRTGSENPPRPTHGCQLKQVQQPQQFTALFISCFLTALLPHARRPFARFHKHQQPLPRRERQQDEIPGRAQLPPAPPRRQRQHRLPDPPTPPAHRPFFVEQQPPPTPRPQPPQAAAAAVPPLRPTQERERQWQDVPCLFLEEHRRRAVHRRSGGAVLRRAGPLLPRRRRRAGLRVGRGGWTPGLLERRSAVRAQR